MKTRKEIEADIEKIKQTRDKLQSDLAQLEKEETIHLNQAGEDAIAGVAGTSMQALATVRAKKESIDLALHLIGNKLESAKLELQHLEYAETQEVWNSFEKECWAKLATIQATIGENGIKGELDRFYDRIRQVQATNLGAKVQDGSQKLDKFYFAYMTTARALFEAWKALDAVQQYQPGYKAHQDITQGFGKLP